MGKRFSTLNIGVDARKLESEVEACMQELGSESTLDDKLESSVSDFTPGAILKGTVVRMAGDDLVVDIGYKSEGFIDQGEFDNISEIREALKENTPIQMEVYLDQIEDDSGLVVLSKKKADRIRGWERVMELYKVDDVVKGKAIRKIKGGLLVDIGVPVFLPASQIDVRRVGDPGDWVGKEMECKIIKIDNERRNIVLSRRRMMEDARDRMKKELLENIQKGEIRRGVVKNLTDFGAFIDLGGIDGLLHITDISWGRIQHPSEVVKVEQTVEVKVLDFDRVRERISLGLKQLQPNPWTQVIGKYPVGSKHKGEVVNIMPYGAFVKLEPGIEGLVHVSEMSWTRNIQHPNEVVALGQEVEVVVLDINQDKQEISLGMKQAEENPWTHVEEKYPPDTRIKGTVRNMTTYGAFVELDDGIDGLLHVSDMSWTKKITHPSALLKKGDPVEAVVLSVDKNRKRVALGLKQLSEDPWQEAIPKQFKPGDRVKGVITKLTSFGAFVEISEDLEGLLHISEMSDGKIEKPEEIVQPGQTLELKILNVDPNERKIGLSLKAMLPGADDAKAGEDTKAEGDTKDGEDGDATKTGEDAKTGEAGEDVKTGEATKTGEDAKTGDAGEDAKTGDAGEDAKTGDAGEDAKTGASGAPSEAAAPEEKPAKAEETKAAAGEAAPAEKEN